MQRYALIVVQKPSMLLHEEFTLHIRKCRLTWVIDILGPWELFMSWFPIAEKPIQTLMIHIYLSIHRMEAYASLGNDKPSKKYWVLLVVCMYGRWGNFLDWNYRLNLCEDKTLRYWGHPIVMYWHESMSLFWCVCVCLVYADVRTILISIFSLPECRRYPVVVDCPMTMILLKEYCWHI